MSVKFKGLRQTVTKRTLFVAKRKILLGVADYFHRLATACVMPNTWLRGYPSPPVRWNAPARICSKTEWSDRVCAGPSPWPEDIVKLRALN